MYDNTVIVVLMILIVAIYMLPTLLAYGRDHARLSHISSSFAETSIPCA